MKLSSLGRVLRRITRSTKHNPDGFLGEVAGVIHVGANTGQERDTYARYGLHVLWVEPIPEIFDSLSVNIAGYDQQRAVRYLVTDQDDASYEFHIANNQGASSSILDFKDHVDIWPAVNYTHSLNLRSVTLVSLLEREHIDAARYDALVMDTQGTELLVLKGAAPILRRFKYIKTEVPDFESYAGCCQIVDIENFLKPHGFHEVSRLKFAHREAGGAYFDIVYERSPRG